MRKFLILLAVFIALNSQAQVHLGVFGGIANYQGDLTAHPYQATKGAGGLTVRYRLNTRMDLRASLIFAKVGGADSLNRSDLRSRNLSFQSGISELSIVAELNTFNLDYKSWSPYIFAGVGVYRFNPYTLDASGNKIYLQPLGTEGQGLPGSTGKLYSRTGLAIPFGGGVKFNISESVRLALEVGLRKLFTDHLDDISGNYADAAELLSVRGQRAVDISYRSDELPGGSPSYPAKGEQRGSPKYKDYYYFTGLHLMFKLPEGSGGGRSGKAARKSGYGCPTVF